MTKRDNKIKRKNSKIDVTSVEYAEAWCKKANKKSSKYIKVKKSGVHNYGVFAVRDIRKGTKIIEYAGQLVSKKESAKRQDRDANNGTIYVFTLNKKHDIDGAIGGCHARLLNHSCDENCITNGDDKSVWIEANRAIKKGEELGYDYCFDEDEAYDHPCRCGSKNCRKYIIGEKMYNKFLKKYKHKLDKNKKLKKSKTRKTTKSRNKKSGNKKSKRK